MSGSRPLSADEEKRLVAAATAVRENAAAPYSKFRVGAALKAISEGAKGFRAVAVVTDAEPPASPCGACRQVLWDQCRDIDVVIATPRGIATRTRLATLLPLAFEF